MRHILPVNYPTIIEKFLNEKFNKAGENADLMSIDIYNYNDVEYQFDIYTEEGIVRIKNNNTQVRHTVTKYDGAEDLMETTELYNLLNHIEDEVTFSVQDWLDYYLTTGPIYRGNTLSIYKTGASYVVDIKNGGALHINGDVISHSTKVTNTFDTSPTKLSAVYQILSESTDSGRMLGRLGFPLVSYTLSLFNAEYISTYITGYGKSEDAVGAINKEILKLDTNVDICGMKVTINEHGIRFESGKYQYNISASSNWSKKILSEPVVKGIRMFSTYAIKFETQEDRYFIRGVINALNEAYDNMVKEMV